jgi:glutaryl-CoA dehydrogenase
MAVRADLFESPDHYQLDDLLSEEHLMVRTAVRDYVKRNFSHH